MTKSLLALILLGALSPGLRAAEVVTSAAGFAFPSIQEGAGARAIAMGSTYVGIDEGSDALLWNPAGLGTLMDPEVAEHHNAALVGSSQDVAVLGLPLGEANGLGVSLDYENNGSFDGRDATGADTGGYSANAYGGSVGWGVGITKGLYLGATLKLDQENLAGTDLDSFAGDIGALWNIAPKLSVGAAYTNIGPAISGWQLEQGLRVGVSSHFFDNDYSQWLAAVSGQSLTDGDSSVHFGLEDTMYKLVSLRAGYAFSTNGLNTDTSDLLGWTFGAGITIRELQIDYAYVPLSDLGAMQRVSLTYNFGCHCLYAPVATLVPNETLIVLNDDDFKPAAYGYSGEVLTKEAQDHLYQALTQISNVKGATLKVSGESSSLRHPGIAGNRPKLRALGESRSQLVQAYMEQEMPQARITSELSHGSQKDTSASLFAVELH